MITLKVNLDSIARILDIFLAAGMEAIRAGKVGGTILTFFPTSVHLARPSLLEVNMSESLLSGLRQAIQFVANQRPDSARFVSRMTDLVLTLLELQSIFRNNATLGEHYMGLERTSGGRGLSSVQRIAGVSEAVLMPYFSTAPQFRDKPLLSNYKLLRSVFALLYIVNLSPYSNPIHFLLGLQLRRTQKHRGGKKSKLDKLGGYLVWLLVYCVQLAQWYFAHESILQPRHKLGKFAKDVPPPELNILGLPADPRLCPICLRERTNPTALIRNGHVYCYSCIVRKLKTESVSEELMSNFIRRLVD